MGNDGPKLVEKAPPKSQFERTRPPLCKKHIVRSILSRLVVARCESRSSCRFCILVRRLRGRQRSNRANP